LKDFILPLFALVGGILSLWVDFNDKRKRWLVILGLVLTAGTTIAFNASETRAKQEELRQANQEKADTRQVLLNITNNVQSVADKIGVLTSMGFTRDKAAAASGQQIATAVQANDFYSESLGGLSGSPSRDIQVEYFQKNVDGNRVKEAITQSGMQVTLKNPVNDLDTNCVWIGDRITADEAKFVAFSLTRAGVGLAAVRRFQNGSGAKARLIEIGADPELVHHPVLTPPQIKAQVTY
jgi:hypothetical protein